MIRDVKLTNPEAGGEIIVYGASAATVLDSELGSAWVDELSPVTFIGNVIADGITVNEFNPESVGGESVIRDNVLGNITLGGPVIVEGNEFPAELANEDGPIGVYVLRGGGWVVRDNVIRGHSYGMQALPDGVIEGNIIEGNDIGFYYTGDPPAMSGNRICDSKIANVRGMQTDAELDATANEICPE